MFHSELLNKETKDEETDKQESKIRRTAKSLKVLLTPPSPSLHRTGTDQCSWRERDDECERVSQQEQSRAWRQQEA